MSVARQYRAKLAERVAGATTGRAIASRVAGALPRRAIAGRVARAPGRAGSLRAGP